MGDQGDVWFSMYVFLGLGDFKFAGSPRPENFVQRRVQRRTEKLVRKEGQYNGIMITEFWYNSI